MTAPSLSVIERGGATRSTSTRPHPPLASRRDLAKTPERYSFCPWVIGPFCGVGVVVKGATGAGSVALILKA